MSQLNLTLNQSPSFFFNLINNCSSQHIWPAIHTAYGDITLDPLRDILIIPPNTSVQTLPLSIPWSGRVWARQFCSSRGDNCLLGDCGSSSCLHSSSASTTLFEMTVLEADNMNYDISLGK